MPLESLKPEVRPDIKRLSTEIPDDQSKLQFDVEKEIPEETVNKILDLILREKKDMRLNNPGFNNYCYFFAHLFPERLSELPIDKKEAFDKLEEKVQRLESHLEKHDKLFETVMLDEENLEDLAESLKCCGNCRWDAKGTECCLHCEKLSEWEPRQQ